MFRGGRGAGGLPSRCPPGFTFPWTGLYFLASFFTFLFFLSFFWLLLPLPIVLSFLQSLLNRPESRVTDSVSGGRHSRSTGPQTYHTEMPENKRVGGRIDERQPNEVRSTEY